MIRLLTAGLLAVSVLCSAQKSPIKFGDIPMEDMKMEVYSGDSSASAVILADYGEAYVSVTSVAASLRFERHVRIKILKKDGLGAADAAVPLFNSGGAEEKLTSLKAVTYNLEGGKIVETKMAKDAVFKEKFNRNINLSKFTLPNVKEGTIFEYSYTIASEFLSNFPNWQFQYKYPVRHSEYWAIIPDFFVMEKYMQGYLQPTTYEAKNRSQSGYTEDAHHWVIKNVPAFKEEPYMTCEEDYMSKINFALSVIKFPNEPIREIMTSWKKLNNDLLESDMFGNIISGSNYLKKPVEEIIAGEADELKKIEKIYTYVRSNVEWDGTKDYLAEKPKDILEKKKGSSGDVNLLLASMLDKAGIAVDMVLLSTRDHGFIREQYPMSKQFNYVVCGARINGKLTFLDATDKFLPVGVLPERCLNGNGLVVSKNFHGWVPLESKTKDRLVTNVDLTLDESGELSGKITFAHDGYSGGHMRKELAAKGEAAYTKAALGQRINWQVSNTSFENVDDNTKSVKETHDVVITDHAQASGNVIYLNPMVSGQIVQNQFKTENRVYPVDFGSLKERVYLAKIIIPDGFLVEELPKNKMMALPGNTAKFAYSCTQVGNIINVTSTFQINRNIFVQDEYPLLREFYSQVVAKQAEQIVLKKK